jgi:hypothetical protein
MLAELIEGDAMDWKLAMQEERAALKRIVALLFALANLAESAGRHSRLVRAFVLWVLRHAETVAWDFVVGAEAPPVLMPVGPTGDSAAEAMRLARLFRDLARELDRQANLALAVQHGSQDNPWQAGFARFRACRALDAHDFPNALQLLAVVNRARRAACATGPPNKPRLPAG